MVNPRREATQDWECSDATDGLVMQLAMPGFASEPVPAKRRARRRTRNPQTVVVRDASFLDTYAGRLNARGAARNGAAAYRYQLAGMERTATRLAGRPIGLRELFQDIPLLGRALVDDLRSADGGQFSRWTLAQRRSAVRSFVSLMRPELVAILGEDPHEVLDRALRSAADRVGGGYRLGGGAPRHRGGRAPTREDVDAVIAEAGNASGFAGVRNRAFFTMLAATGARVNALRELDGNDCVVLPSGRMRLLLREKGKPERRDVELGREHAELLVAYAEAFNGHASRNRWRVRVRLGAPGAVWRNSPRGRWSYGDVLATLSGACVASGVAAFKPHDLRRAFATDAASQLPRHTVALAGGWRGLERLDDHYVTPRPQSIWGKLLGADAPTDEDRDGSTVREAVVAL